MEPVYMNMQSYPHQDPLHYRPRCYSGMEPRPPMSYGCWPWGSNYGYAAPGACHGCSNHAYMPVAWGSPFSHVPPHHCPGNYPYFPAQYMPPRPYNVMEHPRYEYEKNVPMEHHCCGCPNHHPLYPKEQKTARIEEEEPERERERERERESRKNDSLIPLQIKNSPYPIVWLPPDYKEHGKVQNAEGRKDASRDVKVREDEKTAGQQPPSLKGWLPVDLNNVLSSKKRGDGEENVPQDGGKQNFQFPLFWIPYKPDDMEHESHKVKDVNLKPSLELEKGSDGEQKFHVNRRNVGDQTSRVKDIPVKEAEQLMGKESSIILEKERDTSVRDRTDKGEKKIETVDKVHPTEGSKRKSPSPPKSSKLPPVCLRVDPLPRKKSANGKLRSPSPLGDKQKLEVKSNEASKPRSLDSGEPVKEAKDAKTVAVVDGSASPEESMNVNVETLGKLPAKSKDDVSMKQAEVKPEEEQVAQKQAEHDAVVKGQSQDIVSAKGENEEPLRADGMEVVAVNKRRELSEEEAAVIIQSAYRRFNVCRWKPVEKLKLIARVREQITDVKRLIQELELSSDIQGRAKQKNFIAETIMSLLLKLDTIQGLHPSIREVRKSVVRELVSLQEQLDSLPGISPTNESMMRCDHEDASNKSEDATTSESGNEINSVELQNQIDGGDNSEEVNLVEEAAGFKIGMEETSESSVDEGVKAAQVPATKYEDEEEESSEVLQNNETSIAKEHHETINHGQASELSCLVDESSDRVTDSAPDDHDVVQSELAELPQGVLDDLDRSAVEADSSVSDHSKHVEEALIGSPSVQEPHQETANEENHQTMEAHKASAVEEDSSIAADHSKHVEEALIGSPSVQQPHHETADEENHQAMEAHEALDLPLDGAELGTEQTEIGGSLDNKFEEEVYSRGGDARSEPNEHTPQQLENVTAILIEPSERELPTVEACTTNDKSLENSASTMEDEPLESQPEEGDLEKTNPTNDAVNMDEVERAAEAESNDVTDACIAKQTVAVGINHSGAGASEESLPQITEACQPGEAEHEEDNTDKGSPGEDDIRERNRRLMEENERLREMMKKLIKSGQEQLTAISSLSGRVKDMEKRLSRKKKRKVKQYKAPKSSKFDGEKKTIDVAL